MAMLDLLASLVPVYCTGLVEVEDGEEPVLLPFDDIKVKLAHVKRVVLVL
jgi:hypothetical protein